MAASTLKDINAKSANNTGRSAEQDEAVKQARRAKRSKANADTVFENAAAPAPDMQREGESDLDFIDRFLKSISPAQRIIAAYVLPLVASVGAGITLNVIVATVIITFNIGIVLGFLIWVLGAIASFYIGCKIGQNFGGYILNGDIDADIVEIKDTVKGWFSFGDKSPVVA